MKFPTFKLQDQNEKIWQLKDLKGTWSIVFIYPRAMTPGCTVESREFSTAKKKLEKLGVQVIGLSRDEAPRQKKFEEKENLTVPLLADVDQELMKKLDAWKEKNMYGKTVFGAERSTFVVDPQGTIIAEWRKVKVPGHVDEVLAKVKELVS